MRHTIASLGRGLLLLGCGLLLFQCKSLSTKIAAPQPRVVPRPSPRPVVVPQPVSQPTPIQPSYKVAIDEEKRGGCSRTRYSISNKSDFVLQRLPHKRARLTLLHSAHRVYVSRVSFSSRRLPRAEVQNEKYTVRWEGSYRFSKKQNLWVFHFPKATCSRKRDCHEIQSPLLRLFCRHVRSNTDGWIPRQSYATRYAPLALYCSTELQKTKPVLQRRMKPGLYFDVDVPTNNAKKSPVELGLLFFVEEEVRFQQDRFRMNRIAIIKDKSPNSSKRP
ncbi:MAG: hypothetical protein EP343_16930 [Deltaproteobacteria bacterium]|nr:MAG: hypothetical protein EP343_16930 [Deltaproteobacteria bacterium]